MISNLARCLVLLFLLCAHATSAATLSEEPALPRCRPMAETRTPIPLWREDLSGIRQFMAARPLNADTIVYISYTASIQEVDVEEAGVPYLVPLPTRKRHPHPHTLNLIPPPHPH